MLRKNESFLKINLKLFTGKTRKLKFSPPKSTRGGKDVAKLVRNKSKITIDDGNKVP
jgi:hypothetical protein